MTSATEKSIKELYPLVMDEFDRDPAKAPQTASAIPKPAAVPQPTNPVTITKEKASIARHEPQVNSEPDALTEYLSSLTQERQREIKKYSNLPESDLEIPTEKRAAAILATFCKKYQPSRKANGTTHCLSCPALFAGAGMRKRTSSRDCGSSPGSIASPRTSRATGVMLRNSRNSPGGPPAMCGRVFLSRR